MKTNEIINSIVESKIKEYKPKNGLDSVSLFLLNISKINHPEVCIHLERVALISESTAKLYGIEPKAAFFAGLLHDVGKIVLPSNLFEKDVVITKDDYNVIKTHAIKGFEILRNQFMFVSLCAGLHHSMYENGYGLSLNDFPKQISAETAKKILDISMIVSIADFVDAYTHRKTKILDGSNNESNDMVSILKNKYPKHNGIIDCVIESFNTLEI